MTAPDPQPLSTDISRPSVLAINSIPTFNGTPLDKDKANWMEWKDSMYMSMELHGLWGYTGEDGIVNNRPDPATEPRAAANWDSNDRKACAYITSALALGERRAIEPLRSNAKAFWALLKQRHEKAGAAAQIYLIRDALSLVAHAGDNVPKVLDQAWQLGDRIFAMGDISAHVFKIILSLNVLCEHEELMFPILDMLKNAASTDQVAILDVRSTIEDRFRVMEKNKSTMSATATALVVQSAGRTPLICANCKGRHHTADYCIKPGGGMAGKTVAESTAQRRADKDAQRAKGSKASTPTSPTDKIPGKVRVTGLDSHGHAFALYLDESSVPSASSSQPSIGTGGSAGLESISPDELASSWDDVEYDCGYMASVADIPITPSDLPAWLETSEGIRARVDWAVDSTPNSTDSAYSATSVTSPFHADSGATTHISFAAEDFAVIRPINSRAIRGVNGSVIYATGIGEINLRVLTDDGADHILTLKDALYIPRATVRLVSVSALARFSAINSHFDDTGCWFTDRLTGQTIARGTLSPPQYLYDLNLHAIQSISHVLATTYAPDLEVWHRRLGHVSYQTVKALAHAGTLQGVSSSSIPAEAPKCDACILGKQTKTPVPKSRQEGHRATEKLEVVWVDLTGPMAVVSRTGNKYVMDILDDYTSMSWEIPLATKDQALTEFQAWQLRVETATGLRVKLLRIDGGELKSDEMNSWLASRGTSVEYTAPYTSAHIGRVERLHRTLQGRARAMRLHSKCPPYLWDEFYLTAGYVSNRTLTRANGNTTPYEKWHGEAPDYSHMREIGCRAFVLILNKHNPKIYERSIECVLVGYDLNSKTYRCWHAPTRRVISSYHVKFIESHEQHSPSTTTTELPPPVGPHPPSPLDLARDATSVPIDYDPDDPYDTLPDNPRAPLDAPSSTVNDPIDILGDPAPASPPISAPVEPRRSKRVASNQEDPKPSREETVRKAVHESEVRAQQKRTERVVQRQEEKQRKRLSDIAAEEARNDPVKLDLDAKGTLARMDSVKAEDRVVDEPADGLQGVFSSLTSSDKHSDADRVDSILSAISQFSNIDPRQFGTDSEPRDWEDSQRRPPDEAAEWRAAFEEECKSLRDMGVYTLIPRSDVPHTHTVRKCKAVLKNKVDEHGNLTRRKVRFVFKGFEQVFGRDYTSTTSPTARMESWRILLHIAAALGWNAQQIDVKTAFLYGLLPDNEVQYMEQPRGFEEAGKADWVWKLQRGLYGMKQAGRIWNKTLNETLLGWGFQRLACESCIYYRKTNTGTIITAVHVDDFLSISNCEEENERFKELLRTVWTISDLGKVSYCVGIGVERDFDSQTVSLHQTGLLDKTISQFGQQDAHPAKTPMDPGLKLRRPDHSNISAEDRSELAKLPYRSLVGCLIYLSVGTRPDITYAVQQLSQFLDSYSYAHWNAAIRVVRYLKGTRHLRLVLGGTNGINLTGFTDSDWANCLDTRRSVGGYAFTLGSGVVSWAARKHKTVASSSCEAEYMAAFEAAKEVIWLRALLKAINFECPEATTVLCDNNAAITVAQDPSLHQRMKHVDIRYHFLRERVNSDEIKLSYINTNNNLADIFTKALDTTKFVHLRQYLGLSAA